MDRRRRVDQLRDHALKAYDRIIGLDLSEVALDGSQQKAPCGGEGTGKNPVDRAKLGWKWSVATDRAGIPLGWAIDGANRSDLALLEPTLADVARIGLLTDIETLHLDRLYDFPKIKSRLAALGLNDLNIPRRRPRGAIGPKPVLTFGLRWIVESTNSWFTNYGQLRRNTDRHSRHRHAHYASPPPSSSPSNFSPGETAGSLNQRLSARPLRFAAYSRRVSASSPRSARIEAQTATVKVTMITTRLA